MELQTSTGAISIAEPGGAFAKAGNAVAGVGLFGGMQDQTTEQLTQLNRTMQNVSGSLQAVGNSMASLGDEVVFGNQQLQQTLQGPAGFNTTGGVPVAFQGFGNVGFQQFLGGGAVGAGGAANNPLGFLNSTFGQLGLQLPAGIPTSGGGGTVSPNTGTGTGTGTIGTGTGGCSMCGAATNLGNAASDLSGAANQLGNVSGELSNAAGGPIPQFPGAIGGGGGRGTGGTSPVRVPDIKVMTESGQQTIKVDQIAAENTDPNTWKVTQAET